ncbi:hypothetical protein IGI04_015191 [Brassica rapa subsp. trilocularis]|uniref:Uncharacterized protein n=1 Tax=Brassica rapa subsp. trilocularis TaxID=1813537 RepID=A0ABQ7MPC1_BRACM|nr:hypothetical protein IGI04_015191 [Brassica rapa subsp. trilocularis]
MPKNGIANNHELFQQIHKFQILLGRLRIRPPNSHFLSQSLDDLFFKSDDRDNDEDRDFQTNLEETKPGGVDKEKKEEKEQEGFTRTSTSVPQGPKFLGAAWQRLQLNIFERGLLIEVYGDRGVGELWFVHVTPTQLSQLSSRLNLP